jgi:hypothetical protein
MQEIFPETARRIEQYKSRPGVLGVLLVGSKSRGHADQHSDDDLEVFLTDEEFSRIAPRETGDLLIVGEGETRRIIYDTQYLPLSDLERKASSPIDLDRWPYEKARVLFDLEGRLAPAVEDVAWMSPEFRRLRLLHATIDAWTAPFLVAKARRHGANSPARLYLGRGVLAVARILFGLEYRWVPLFHWLEKELMSLEDSSCAGDLLLEALREDEVGPLQEALRRLEERLFAEGVPRSADRHALFYELVHPSRAEERAIHGLS